MALRKEGSVELRGFPALAITRQQVGVLTDVGLGVIPSVGSGLGQIRCYVAGDRCALKRAFVHSRAGPSVPVIRSRLDIKAHCRQCGCATENKVGFVRRNPFKRRRQVDGAVPFCSQGSTYHRLAEIPVRLRRGLSGFVAAVAVFATSPRVVRFLVKRAPVLSHVRCALAVNVQHRD